MATQTTDGGSTISFGNAPQANNDSFAFTEEANNILVLNVMANDLGGAAKTLFSLDDGTNASASTKTYAPADLLVKDVAYSSDTAGMTGTGDHSALGARIWIESDGFVHYDKGDINAQLQALAVGATLTDTFTYAIQLGNGTLSWATVTLQFSGANDQVYITSSPQSGTVVEDAPATPDPSDSLSTVGTISFSDVDLSDAHAASFAAAASNTTTLGTFSLDPVSEAANAANGSVQWHYTLNNAAAQYLAQGQSVTESFVATINDGHGSTATQTVTVTITGTNDAVSITSGAQSGTVVEDAPATPYPADSLEAAGTISFSDVDLSDAHTASFAAAASNTTTLGTFSLDPVSEAANAANGSVQWHYTLNNAAAQYLAEGQSVTESFVVTVNDGHGSTATQTVTVTITGTNDAATVSSDAKSVTEGDAATALNTSGQLTIVDPDSGEAHVVAQSSVHGSYGDFSIDANGAWSYTGNGAHNELTAGQQVQDQFTVMSQDGTASGTVTVTITGTNDVASVSSDPKSVTEADTATALNTSGQLTITDPDTGEAHVVAQSNVNGSYGDFSIDASGAWSYTGNGAHNELTAGQQVQDQFTVTSQDGTATGTVTVTITGTNDAATVSSDAKSVTEADTATALNTSGQLTITDPDSGEAHVVGQSNVHGTYGDFSIDASGAWSYAGNGAHNELTAGQQVQDQFTVTSQDGTATGTVTVTITGTNDAATVSSEAKAVTEGDTATALNTSGQLTIVDPDSGEAHVVVQSNAHGAYGDFSIDANGAWSYTGNDAHDELTAGQLVQDQFTVVSQDSTATGTVTVTITGTNDAATVSSDSKSVTEGDTAAALNTSGQLSIVDPDSGEAHVVAQSNAHGSYGDFSIDANGAWSYSGNGAHNELIAGQQVQDQFTVVSQDGTASGTVTVTITGTNDAATVSSDSKSVTEADIASALNTSGQLIITDPDTGEAHVVAQSNVHGSYGDFSIDANGAWSYAGNGAHNELTAGQQVQDQFTVVSQDGTASGTVTVTITGTNDVASVSSDSKSVTEADSAAALNTSGQLTITDPDTGEAHVVAQSNAHGSYGDFSIDANGAWSYAGNGAHNELTAGQQVQDQFTVVSQDGTATGTVTVTITGTNDAPLPPVDGNAVTNTVAEGAAAGTSVGVTAASSDVDGPAVSYSLVGDSSNGGFAINSTSGVVTVADPSKIDYESAAGHAYSVTVQASDGTLTSQQSFSFAVTDVAPSIPVDGNTATNTVAEGAAAGTSVGITASSSDVDGPAVSYSLVGDSSNGGFAINSTTGVVTVADPSKISYVGSGSSHSYSVTARASDGALNSQQTFSIAVTQSDITPPTASVSHSLSSSHQTSTFTVTASDASGIKTVQLYDTVTPAGNGSPNQPVLIYTFTAADIVNGNYVHTFTDGQAPFTSLNNDTHKISAVVTDNANNSATVFDPVTFNTNAGSGGSTKFSAPAGIAGSAINLGLTDPTGQMADVTLTITGTLDGWSVHGGTHNADGSWSITTHDLSSLTITTASDYVGASVLKVTEHWTNADGSVRTATVLDNLEAYAPGSPIFAWSGDDTLTGSSGHDTFVLSQPIGNDKIYSFDGSSDLIDLIRYGWQSFSDIQAHSADDANGNAVITLADGQTITLDGVHAADLTAANFEFDATPTVENSGAMSIGNGAMLPLSGIIHNTGTIELHSSGDDTLLQLIQTGVKLDGGGHVILSDDDHNIIAGTAPDVTLDNIDNTISGAGQLGHGNLSLSNAATILADGVHALVIDTGQNVIVNAGTLEATGTGGLQINSAIINTGLLWANGGAVTALGEVSGSGSAEISGIGTIEFGAACSANVTIDANATGHLVLDDAFHFTGTVSGLTADDDVDLKGVNFSGETTLSFTENQAGTGGTLTVSDGAHTANIVLLGQYDPAGFTAKSDIASNTVIAYDPHHIA